MFPDTSQRRGVDASLLRVIVESYVARALHPVAEIRQFEQLMLGMIDALDADAVAEAVAPLCRHPDAPPGIFPALHAKGGACARLALQFGPMEAKRDLLAVAVDGDAESALVIARRADLDRDVIVALAGRRERDVLYALALNRSARFDATARHALTGAARDDLTLARLLLERAEMDVDPEPLYLAATPSERQAIVINACRKVLAAGPMEKGRVDPDFLKHLEEAAARQDREEMAALFGAALECRKERALALLCDPTGEALALALAALGVDAEAAARILPCGDAAVANDETRQNALLALLRATPQRAAARIVSAVTGATRNEKESARRAGVRDDALAAPGWRRATTRKDIAAPRKIDQSA